ncbi:MAG: WbqC family protein [Bacteroidota bacterium]
MLVAIRPPEFAPPLAAAALLLVADRVVLADTFAFSRQSHHNRARIDTGQGYRWLTVPRRHGGVGIPLAEVEVVDDGWRQRHRTALRAAYGKAPFYEHVAPEWDAVLDTKGPLADLTVASVRLAARWLRAPAEILRASEVPGALTSVDALADAVGASALLALPKTADVDARLAPGREVQVLHLDLPAPGLSILDLLMRRGPAAADDLRARLSVRALDC